MKKLTDGFREIGGDGRERWFAGANTDRGFSGSYGGIFREERLSRLYVIKGGPGTGKSTLMKRAAEEAEAAGCPVVRCLCGSDPDSLDAVLIDGRIALADGTAPHPLDMEYPGASSSLVDLSRYWDTGVLIRSRGEIRELTEHKRTAYREAYRYLSAAGRMAEEMRALASDCFERDKASGFVDRLIRRLRKEGDLGHAPCGAVRRYSHGITMRGLWKTDAVTEGSVVRFVLEDDMGTAGLLLSMLAEALEEAGAEASVGLFPIGDAVAGIRSGHCSFRIGTAEDGEIPIRMPRFVRRDSAERGRMRLTERIARDALDAAVDSLSRAADAHFGLEEIYRSAMDFDRLAEHRHALCEEILGRLESE